MRISHFIFRIYDSYGLGSELFSNARFNTIWSGSIYIGRFAGGGFINTRLSIFLDFKNTKSAFLYFIYILKTVTTLILISWNIFIHLARYIRCILSLNSASVSPLYARLNAANALVSSDWNRWKQRGGIISRFIAFSIQ